MALAFKHGQAMAIRTQGKGKKKLEGDMGLG